MIADLQREREDLLLADRHLAAGERRIAGQRALIQRMTEHGYNTTTARDLLRLLEETMVLWQDHRRLILDVIARRERASAPPPPRDRRPEAP